MRQLNARPRDYRRPSLRQFSEERPERRPVVLDGARGFPCAECGVAVLVLTKRHVASHGLTREQYIERHPQHRGPRHWAALSREAARKLGSG